MRTADAMTRGMEGLRSVFNRKEKRMQAGKTMREVSDGDSERFSRPRSNNFISISQTAFTKRNPWCHRQSVDTLIGVEGEIVRLFSSDYVILR
jgi:hypothetical protein